MKKNHLFLLAFLFISQGCITIFSDFQSADTLGEGNTEFTPGTSVVIYDAKDIKSTRAQTNLGAQFGYGLTNKTDLRFRIELPSAGDDYNIFGEFVVLGGGPKFQLSKDKVAAYVPIGFAFGEGIETSETLEIQPTLLVSLPISDKFEFNPSAKIILPINDDRDIAFALNFGAGIWNKKIGVRPEIGLMKSLDGVEGTFVHYGIAFSLRSKKK